MNDESFSRLAASFIQPFEKYGFKIVEQEYYPSDFGNAYVTFEDDLRLRVLRDRGQIFVEVSPLENPDDWYDLRVVLEFLGEPVDMQRSMEEEGLKELRDKLETMYARMRSLFDKDHRVTRAQLEQFRNEKARERLGS